MIILSVISNSSWLKIPKCCVIFQLKTISSSSVNKMADTIEQNKKKFLDMPIEEKRKHYHCKTKYNPLENIETWAETITKISPGEKVTAADKKQYASERFGPFNVNKTYNMKVSMWQGDITTLEIDAIVNAANESLLGGGGVDGAIHRAAGPELKAECATLKGCPTGEAKITGGYRLPAKYVIHTVGPRGVNATLLSEAYYNSLRLLRDSGLRTVAFPCISTGIYGYPNEDAARIALEASRGFLDWHGKTIDRIIFCLFLEKDIEIYRRLMQVIFPAEES